MRIVRAVASDFGSATLKDRAHVHMDSDLELLLFRAAEDDKECGLLILDLASGDEDEAILLEIFVLHDLRLTGLGTAILAYAEKFARDAQRTRMTLDAEPLDTDDDNAKISLIKWYKARGYVEVAGRYDHLEKTL